MISITCTWLLFICDVFTAPILKIDVARFRQANGDLFALKYIDSAHDQLEAVTVNCKLPLATSYKWEFQAKIGSGDVGSLLLADVDSPQYEWERTLSFMAYSWELMVIKCSPMLNLDMMMTFVFIALKMKSSTDTPYHPVICEHPQAECWANKLDCFTDLGRNYRGKYNMTIGGKFCQEWSQISGQSRVSMGKHKNYCRNLDIIGSKLLPYCPYTNDKYIHSTTGNFNRARAVEWADCFVPRCAECKFGDGKGNYPGFNRNKNWKYPEFEGNGLTTKMFHLNANGKKVVIQCHKDTSSYWNYNFCRLNNKVNDQTSNLPNVPSCLAIQDPKPEDLLSKDRDNANWNRLKWTECDAPQCVVRQVWFLIIDSKGTPFFNLKRGEAVEISIHLKESTVIKFFHFGTTHCNGMSIDGDDDVKSYIDYLQLDCKNTPNMSFIRIREPIKELAGTFYIKYEFLEGFKELQSTVYQQSFIISVKNPLQCSLPAINFCPGYSTTVTLQVTGSYVITGNLIKWYYSANSQDWNDVDNEVDDKGFVISHEGFDLVIKKTDRKYFIKVSVLTPNEERIEVIKEAVILDTPYLKVGTSVLEVKNGNEATLEVETKLDIVTNWIFAGLLINKQDSKSYVFSSSLSNDSTVVEKMKITKMSENLEGIYTIQAILNGCKNEQIIHVSLKAS